MLPEEQARQTIDKMLDDAGWVLQYKQQLNLGAGRGVAVREFPLQGGLEADYLLFVDRQAVGVVEAKPEGTTLTGVAEQSTDYITSLPPDIPHVQLPLPFAYESTGRETLFRDMRDPDTRSRHIFHFHKPETLAEWIAEEDTLRSRLRDLPELDTQGLWDCQIEAIRNLEQSFAANRPRALIQMATGSGKTFTAVSFIYRLIKFAKARRVLFLVDRRTLGRQTFNEFQQYAIPQDGRKFTQVYNVQHLTSNSFDPVCKVTISTIQRLYSMLRGEELDPELEDVSAFDISTADERERVVQYNRDFPIETFDFIITDECHRSIYNLWRQVLEYFDSFIIGLTATPSKQTLGFFKRNLVMEYPHERAVADGVNVGYDIYRIRTRITESGSTVESGNFVDKRSKLTRERRWEQLDEDFTYNSSQLDRSVVSEDQIRIIIRTFRDKLFTDIFPGRKEVPKTLIFAKDDSHAEDIVNIVREEFGKGNEFCKKITYRTTGDTPENLIAGFRNSYNPRIAISVDMISTGTDIRPLECLIFMRDVKSRVYFDQMKGRGTRVISSTDIEAVTPDTKHKTHFVIIDAAGVTESDKTDTRPLERKPTVPFDKLLLGIALGKRAEDSLTSLANRLARLNREIEEKDRAEIEQKSNGITLREMVNNLLDAVDPDVQTERAKELFNIEEPQEEQIEQATKQLVDEACTLFDNADLRNTLIEIKQRSEQTIDTVSKDEVLHAGGDDRAKERALATVNSFKQFIEENKDEITALQILYSRPYGSRHLTYESIKELAAAIEKPPYQLDAEKLWQAYLQLEKTKVRGAGVRRLLTDIISLIRFAMEEEPVLEPFADIVNARFEKWLAAQELAGRGFTPEQVEWLRMIKEHIASSVSISVEDFEYAPFHEKGGPVKARQLFGSELDTLIVNLSKELVA